MPDALSFHFPIDTMLFVSMAFLVAGTVKGIVGLGLPAILMVSLTLIMPPIEAIPLIVLPMLMTNIVQFLRGPHPVKTAKEYRIFAFFTFVVIVLVGLNLRRIPEGVLLASIGVAMICFAVPSLYGWRFHIGPQLKWQAVAGAMTGIMGGLSSVWSPPVVMYLMGRNIGKDEFVGISGYLFLVGSIGLGIALGTINLLVPELFIPSMIWLGFTLIGFRIGEKIRAKLDVEVFTKLVMVAFLLMGGRLIIIGAF